MKKTIKTDSVSSAIRLSRSNTLSFYLNTMPIKVQNVIDVGCNVGDTMSYFQKILSPEKIYGFEPWRKNYKKAIRKCPFAVISNVAVSNYDGVAEFNLYQPKQHSLWKKIDEDGRGAVSVPVTRLDTWATNNQITNMDFIKIDTQGNDLNVLMGMGRCFEMAKIIQVEVFFSYEYRDTPLFHDIMSYMIQNHFCFHHFSSLHYNRFGKALWGDAVFHMEGSL